MPKILVVDDAEDARFLLTRLLRVGGFTTDVAEDGAVALERIALAPPDLVLLDVMMPRMNGIEMLAVLRKDPRWHDLPVVLYTAMSDGRLIADAERLGIQDMIVKGSVDGETLLERIARRFPPGEMH
jgi:CheY-like chemotaxis protein